MNCDVLRMEVKLVRVRVVVLAGVVVCVTVQVGVLVRSLLTPDTMVI